MQCFITECLSELAGFERRAYLLPVIIQSSVHDTVVFLSVHTSPDFINGYVIQIQKGVKLRKRMAVVTLQQSTGGMLHLCFHITFRIIHFLQVYQFSLATFSECGMKPVLHFHFPADVLCPDSLPVMVYLFSFLVDAYRNDVHVLAVNIFVQPDNVRLVPVTELFHKLLRQYGHLLFRKNIFGIRIQGDVDNRFPDVRIKCDIRLECLHAVFNRHIAGNIGCNLRMSQYLCRTVIHLYLIIGNHSIE